jgi:putative protease
VFCAVLSPGTNRTNCGRPCDRHEVRLRDRVGMEHPLKADVGCRNTLYNAVPQSAAEEVAGLLDRGVRDFRVELLDEDDPAVERTIGLYRDLLAGRIAGREVWTHLKASNTVGVTRGPLGT